MSIITNRPSTNTRVVLRAEAIERLHRLAGTASKAELANSIGVDPTAFALASTGLSSPSMGLIARIVTAFPQVSFSSLCVVA